MARFDLMDFEWSVIEPLLPTKVRGVKRRDDRQLFDPGSPAGYQRAEKGGRSDCLGRARGGSTTKIHTLVDAAGRPIRLMLSAGQAYGGHAAMDLLDALPPARQVLADRAYDSNAIRA